MGGVAGRRVLHPRNRRRLSISGWSSWVRRWGYTILIWWVCSSIRTHGVVVVVGVCVSRIMLLSLLVPGIVLLLLLLLLNGSRVSRCWLKLVSLCCCPVCLCIFSRGLTLVNGGQRLSCFLPFRVFVNLAVSSSTVRPVSCWGCLCRVGRHFATDHS